MNKLFYIILILAVGFTSCRSTRTAGTDTSDLPRNYGNIKFVTEKLTEERADFEWLTSRLRIKYQDDDQNLSASATVRMQKDKIIWLSVTPMLGIEAFRILITPDSIFSIDRINRVYQVMPFSEIRSIIGIENIDFRFLQDLLIGNTVFDIHKDYNVKFSPQNEIVLANNDRYEKIAVHVTPQNFRPSLVNYNRVTFNQDVTITYANYNNYNGKYFPHNVNFNVTAPQKLNLLLEFNKFTLDEPQELPFTVPSNYERR